MKKLALLLCLLAPRLMALNAGDAVPHFQLKDVRGGVWIPEQASRGRYLLIDFWASWCQPCIKEIPVLKELNRKYAASNFRVLGVGMDKNWELTNKAVAKYGINYSVVLGSPATATAFGVEGFPTAMLVHEGKVLKVFVGERTLADFDTDLGGYLKRK